MSTILVVNSGSSSIKYQILVMETERALARGLVERIGSDHGLITHTGPAGTHARDVALPDHRAGFAAMLDDCSHHGPDLWALPLAGIGHRVVHGGDRFVAPTPIDERVEAAIEQLTPLAPLHNPANLLGIRAARTAFPAVPQVAVFDTAFHQTMPPAAYTYAIDAGLAERHGVRRYGFHGTSHKFVSEQVALFLERPLEAVNSIVLHLGNGASACAVRGGRSIDTSMGMTPLAGLVMGTRGGDIDPGVLLHLHRHAGLGVDELDDLLNHKSGLFGLTGASDMRDVQRAASTGDERAALAIDVYCHRLRHYVGAYYAQLGRVDAIAFTAGVGEHSPGIRETALTGLDGLGIRLDRDQNRAETHGIRRISTADSDVAVLVIPTNEELEIARQTLTAIEGY